LGDDATDRLKKTVGIYSTKSKWQQALRPVVAVCARNRIPPNVFTYGALGLSGIAAAALGQAGANRAWLWLVPPCLLIRLLFNLLDGLVARELGMADAWGEVKNEFGDRLADAAIFLGLAFGGYADARLAALVIALVLCVSHLGLLGKAIGGARVYGGVFGKGDRMISLALFTFLPLLGGDLTTYNGYLAFAACAAGLTLLQRLSRLHGQQSSR
jgi:CDP-diacylglycerol--glycerol-3-phosphate 3-phosphatidyltransferase